MCGQFPGNKSNYESNTSMQQEEVAIASFTFFYFCIFRVIVTSEIRYRLGGIDDARDNKGEAKGDRKSHSSRIKIPQRFK